ncbi:MAG: hypothetical protein RMJ66_07390 [Bacteroidia bacterium]|nr:hypothetical protein [Bacteroidia bacterium]MDW8134877.1 hypothetical protein [Bacteroidia bacterium]
MPISIAWLLPQHSETHYGILAEAYARTLEILSERAPIWGISWNVEWGLSNPNYTLHIWNGMGRHVGFWGPWPVRTVRRVIEKLWQAEEFRPQIVQLSSVPWAKKLGEKWRRRYAAKVIPPLPFLSQDFKIGLPASGLPLECLELAREAICIFASAEAISSAAYIGEILALAQHRVIFLGTPPEVTPLRNAARRFPSRIYLRLGLSESETELYVTAAKALIFVGKGVHSEMIIQWGKPWLCDFRHPLAAWATATYKSAEEIPTLLRNLPTTSSSLHPTQFVERLLDYYACIANAN